MNYETYDFESRIGPEVRSALNRQMTPEYDHMDLWRLVHAWIEIAERSNDIAVAQCAYELSSMIGPYAYA